MNIQPKPTLTFNKCLEMGLDSHVDAIAKVADVASKEFSIEQVQATTCTCIAEPERLSAYWPVLPLHCDSCTFNIHVRVYVYIHVNLPDRLCIFSADDN